MGGDEGWGGGGGQLYSPSVRLHENYIGRGRREGGGGLPQTSIIYLHTNNNYNRQIMNKNILECKISTIQIMISKYHIFCISVSDNIHYLYINLFLLRFVDTIIFISLTRQCHMIFSCQSNWLRYTGKLYVTWYIFKFKNAQVL